MPQTFVSIGPYIRLQGGSGLNLITLLGAYLGA